MTADRHREPGDLDKHHPDWTVEELASRSIIVEDDGTIRFTADSTGVTVTNGDLDIIGNLDVTDGNRVRNEAAAGNSREMKVHSLADLGKAQLLSVASDTGKALVVNRTSGETGEFALDGVNNSASLLSDALGGFSTTEGNAGTTNVYWDTTNARFEIENQTTAAADYSVHLLS